MCEFTSEFIGFVEIFLQSDKAKSKEICSDVSVGSAILPKITPILSLAISEVLHLSNADFPAIAVILNTGSRLSSSIPYLVHNFCIVSSEINAPMSVNALLGAFTLDITEDESSIHLFLGACLNADLPFSIRYPERKFNTETEKAIEEAKEISKGTISVKSYKTAKELFQELDKDYKK